MQDTITVGPETPPPVGGMGGSIHSWERDLDPWHKDAFPEEMKRYAPEQGVRRSGWTGLDAFGNAIHWIPDGTTMKDPRLG